MNILYYNDIDYTRVKKQFNKTLAFLENDDFDSAEIKKLTNHGYYRAKLDYENRLLFKFARYRQETYILLLEVIYNHEYEKSRFLRGAKIDESKLMAIKSEKQIADDAMPELNFVNHKSNKFYLLNKVISFDDVQQNIFALKPPVVIVGSAGSGKTVLTLEKIKLLKGNILYVTLSPFLVDNSTKLYYSDNYVNEKQDVDFLSFKEYLETLKVIPGKEVDFKNFNLWLQPRKQAFGIKDSYKLFEEFKGVITGLEITKAFLSKEDYLNLGVKQSIFLNEEREKVYEAFKKYLEFLNENNYHDLNIISYQWLQYSRAKYDFIVIDEAQDFTNIQLYLVLQSLKTAGNFILCGDSNQIVHPNFFSWTNVKTMFYKHDIAGNNINVLRTNYRNSINITTLANKLLMIKNARFGSIDKESTFLVESLEENKGTVNFHIDSPAIRKQLNESTGRSTKYALLVMTQEEKAAARKIFKTPLLFSIHEAKGLEYENIILVNFIGNYSREFNQIAQGINPADIKNENIGFSRSKDKTDKSLDAYKFYINSLYVGITRAIKNLYILETSQKHDILSLLDLVESKERLRIKAEVSSLDEWKEEARKLEMQGKDEQANEIKKSILALQKPDWDPLTRKKIEELQAKAFDPDNFNKKAKDLVFMYALLYNDSKSIDKLAELNYKRAQHPEYERSSLNRKYYAEYNTDNVKAIKQKIGKYGVDYRDQFNLTPLLAAIENGSVRILKYLLEQNANTDVVDNNGRNPLRIALNKLYFSPQHITKLEDRIGDILTDTIRVKINERMVKIPKQKMEYLLLNVFMTLQDAAVNQSRRGWIHKGLSALDIEKIVAPYPESLMPEFRKKRPYISAMLSKNEIESKNPYNNALFSRIDRGVYCLNPDMSVLLDDAWINIYDLCGLLNFAKLSEYEESLLVMDQSLKNLRELKVSFPDIAFEQEKKLLQFKQDLEEKHRLHLLEKQEEEKKVKVKKNQPVDDGQLEFPF